jgi:hypothetical protein
MTPDATMLARRYVDLPRASGCSERTIDNYLYARKGFARFLGGRPLSGATADDIIAYQADVAARGLSDRYSHFAYHFCRDRHCPRCGSLDLPMTQPPDIHG